MVINKPINKFIKPLIISLFTLSAILILNVIASAVANLKPDTSTTNTPQISLTEQKPTAVVTNFEMISPTPTLIEVNHSLTPTLIPSPTSKQVNLPTAKTTSSSLIDCVGPDKKVIKLSKKACDDFNNAWGTPTPSPKPTDTPQTCNNSTDLANLIVKIEPQSGQSLVGDAAVTMSNGSGSCAGQDSRLPYTQIIRQGSNSVTFSGYMPRKFHIKINYHYNTYESDVRLNSGNNEMTTTVAN